MQIKPINVAKGAATFIPGINRFACGGSGGTDSPAYCYSVWLRHLSRLADAGAGTRFGTVAELGPGDSLGIGVSAMLTGSERYFAFDAVAHARTAANLTTLDQLVQMFAANEPIPGNDQFPELSPSITSLSFPHQLIDSSRLESALHPRRVAAIRAALEGRDDANVQIRYFAPWANTTAVPDESVDLAFSQAVLEHVDDISGVYAALFRKLKRGAVMSHQIDFKSHGLTRDWYGHWTAPSWLWRIVRGRRPYLINRLPASAHLAAIRRTGFEIVVAEPIRRQPPNRRELAAEFRGLSDEDLHTSGLFLIARKPA